MQQHYVNFLLLTSFLHRAVDGIELVKDVIRGMDGGCVLVNMSDANMTPDMKLALLQQVQDNIR